MGKPKEFWIHHRDGRVFNNDPMSAQFIHVIEKKVHDELIVELAVLKADYGNCDAERDSRRLENAALKSRLESVLKMLDEMAGALEKLEAGYAGMFGSNTESPKDDAYRTSPRIISMALNKYRKFKEGLK